MKYARKDVNFSNVKAEPLFEELVEFDIFNKSDFFLLFLKIRELESHKSTCLMYI